MSLNNERSVKKQWLSRRIDASMSCNFAKRTTIFVAPISALAWSHSDFKCGS